MSELSNCCKAPLRVINEDEGTCFYSCDACRMPASPIELRYTAPFKLDKSKSLIERIKAWIRP